jgi:hypothetical protein
MRLSRQFWHSPRATYGWHQHVNVHECSVHLYLQQCDLTASGERLSCVIAVNYTLGSAISRQKVEDVLLKCPLAGMAADLHVVQCHVIFCRQPQLFSVYMTHTC